MKTVGLLMVSRLKKLVQRELGHEHGQVGVDLVLISRRERLSIFGAGLEALQPGHGLPHAWPHDQRNHTYAFLVPAGEQVRHFLAQDELRREEVG